MNDFDGLVAVVTGGASGIGAATVAELVRRGARVAVIDRSVSSQADSSVLNMTADLSNDSQVQVAIDEISNVLGGIDILINNAGIGASGDVAANSDEEWHRVYDINVVGIVRVTRAALPRLRKSQHAAIINTSSVAATNGLRERALYSATKGAVIGLTYAMAADYLAEGIRVNAIAPGTASTPWVERLLEASDNPREAAEALRKRQPTGRLVDPEELAFSIANLASPRAASTSGTVLTVDGGLSTLRV